jgi:hypothetical protein
MLAPKGATFADDLPLTAPEQEAAARPLWAGEGQDMASRAATSPASRATRVLGKLEPWMCDLT